jgi:hypothetical protein
LSTHRHGAALSLDGTDGRFRLESDATLEGQRGTVFGGVLLRFVMRAAGVVTSAQCAGAVQFLRPAEIGEPR